MSRMITPVRKYPRGLRTDLLLNSIDVEKCTMKLLTSRLDRWSGVEGKGVKKSVDNTRLTPDKALCSKKYRSPASTLLPSTKSSPRLKTPMQEFSNRRTNCSPSDSVNITEKDASVIRKRLCQPKKSNISVQQDIILPFNQRRLVAFLCLQVAKTFLFVFFCILLSAFYLFEYVYCLKSVDHK